VRSQGASDLRGSVARPAGVVQGASGQPENRESVDTPTRNRASTPQLKWVCKSCAAEYVEEQPQCDVDGGDLSAVIVDALIGHTFAERYTILSRLGRGGMSTVYKARHALKKISKRRLSRLVPLVVAVRLC
jgi:hypothetical protein